MRLVGAPDALAAAISAGDSRAEADTADALLVFVRDAGELDAATDGLIEATHRGALTWVAELDR